ncbi:hypothetical protein PV325_003103 [Microctonus aethiopoides]|uniref:Uncharacterized protein n=1 Tax=Microctonus aethiopoides TaxID=144406 RepID=A0AA39F6J8_9HYME|nr:hypothetical protein PV325_003103 [Microctonus aethiopoides]KAK0096290.1 hypothetical protein PV326_005876 [Microctonus aethiopoides]KAK0163877.1 hypothetical protein PV328_002563 [Microctonus aethiopoides]
MKTQLIIFLALCGVAFSFNHNPILNVTPSQLKVLIDAQKGCILYDQPCDSMGKMMKSHLPVLSKFCNVNGCSPSLPLPLKQFFDKVQIAAPQEWQAVLRKYAAH